MASVDEHVYPGTSSAPLRLELCLICGHQRKRFKGHPLLFLLIKGQRQPAQTQQTILIVVNTPQFTESNLRPSVHEPENTICNLCIADIVHQMRSGPGITTPFTELPFGHTHARWGRPAGQGHTLVGTDTHQPDRHTHQPDRHTHQTDRHTH